MKNIIIFLALTLIIVTSAFSQLKTNLIFFTDQGEKFSVVLNGVLQNPKPETNIKVTDLVAPNYKLKIIFEDAKLGEIDKNLMFNQGTESTFDIKKNNKGEYVVRWMNEVPIAQALPPAANQSVIVFTTVAPVASTTVTQSTTSTTVNSGTAANPTGTSMGVNINDPAVGVNFNLNVNTNNTGMETNATTTSSSTTTTTTTTSTNMGTTQPVVSNTQPVYVLPGYSGPVGCPYPMSPQDFSGVKSSISSKSFEDSKLAIAKQVIGSNCLLSSQVKEIIMLFSFEDTRLDFAKYSYGYTFDIGNYYQVNDAFKFESSIDDLNAYISTYKR
jgi:hypothetical protein